MRDCREHTVAQRRPVRTVWPPRSRQSSRGRSLTQKDRLYGVFVFDEIAADFNLWKRDPPLNRDSLLVVLAAFLRVSRRRLRAHPTVRRDIDHDRIGSFIFFFEETGYRRFGAAEAILGARFIQRRRVSSMSSTQKPKWCKPNTGPNQS
jgi:hypothetical protein